MYKVYHIKAANFSFISPEVGMGLVTPGTDHRDLKVSVNT